MATSGVSEMNVGKNIAYLRKLRGFTQDKLAEKLNVKQSAVSKFEVNGDKLRSETLWRIGEALDVFPMFLLHTAVHDETAPTHDVLIDVIKNYHADEQSDKYNEALQSEIEERKIAMYKGESVSPEEMEVLDLFMKLNTKGQREAVKRVEELTQLPLYRKE